MPRRGLGRGLEALIPELEGGGEDGAREVPVEKIRPNAFQPRRGISQEGIDELARSIREHGVVQPILVRPVEGGYEIVAGERRWRAALAAGLATVPAVVRELSDGRAMEIAIVENVQREDLSPLEQAMAFKKLAEELNLTQEMVAERVGKSRAHVANIIRLLDLDPAVQEMVGEGRISFGHARALLGLSDRGAQRMLAEEVVAKGLSVREVEERVRLLSGGGPTSAEARKDKRKAEGSTGGRLRDPAIDELEAKLRGALATRVRVVAGKRKGRIEIEYYGDEDLERIVALIAGG